MIREKELRRPVLQSDYEKSKSMIVNNTNEEEYEKLSKEIDGIKLMILDMKS